MPLGDDNAGLAEPDSFTLQITDVDPGKIQARSQVVQLRVMASDATIGTRPAPQARLLVFTLGPGGDCDRRPLLPPALRSLDRDLRAHCLERVLAAGRACGLDVLVSTGDRVALPEDVHRIRQTGPAFAERLMGAIAMAAADRDWPLVVVGSDTPGLGTRHLTSALQAVTDDPTGVVIGPSADGGFYLLASAEPIGDVLEQVRWCRDTTARQLIELLQRQGRTVHLLETLHDLDRPIDLAVALRHAGVLCHHLVVSIRRALREVGRAILQLVLGPHEALILMAESHRGPPA